MTAPTKCNCEFMVNRGKMKERFSVHRHLFLYNIKNKTALKLNNSVTLSN